MNLIDAISKAILKESDNELRKQFEKVSNGNEEEFQKFRKEMYEEDPNWMVVFEDEFMKKVSKRIDEICIDS